MKLKIIVLSLFVFGVIGVNAQNIIVNGDFEQGLVPTNVDQINKATGWIKGCALQQTTATETPYPGTPDLSDKNSAGNGIHKLPYMGVTTRNNGFTNNRCAHLITTSYPNSNNNVLGESIIATLNEPLQVGYTYTVGFWAARTKTTQNPAVPLKVEVVLRKSGNCTAYKVVYMSNNVPYLNTYSTGVTNNWSNHSGTFFLTANEVNQGYDKIEVRLFGEKDFFGILLDDFTLTKTPKPLAAFNYLNTVGQNNMSSYYGLVPVSLICLPNVNIDGSASVNESGYFIEIAEFNLSTWTDIQLLYSGWVSATAQVPANEDLTSLVLNNNTYSATFQTGKIYRVRLAVGPVWNSVDHFFKADCNVKNINLEIENSTNTEEIVLYPNPFNNVLNIMVNDGVDIYSMNILDLNGRMLYSNATADLSVNGYNIDLSELNSGAYLIEMVTSNGVVCKRIIKE